ncbi:response regulator [Helicobacter sp. 16-1353]|uniref:response regulator n=1 Tax=Helicobacter sp. 16-1353 TaxID=2004996 RepID=UPI0015EE57F1|nr:response regulator [Helicobacter sp. 16-1353]
MTKSLIIHYDNVSFSNDFSEKIKFDLPINEILDNYISNKIIPKIKDIKPDIIFIRDILSQNAMEFYGLILAHHIRLSEELDSIRFVPIVILSDLDGYLLSRLSLNYAGILYSNGIFLGLCRQETKKFYINNFKKLKKINSIKEDLLGFIHIEKPQDYESNHDITNEWSIYRWNTFIKAQDEALIKNEEKIKNILYFKYQKALYNAKDVQNPYSIDFASELNNFSGKIAYIDDECLKGWGVILEKLFSKPTIKFNALNIDNNDEKIAEKAINFIESDIPDIVVLDFRLSKNDQHVEFDNISSIEIIDRIKAINPGIQIIIFSATSKSENLKRLQEKGILGYIKKDSIGDSDTKSNIENFIDLIKQGLENKYLKDIHNLTNEINAFKIPQSLDISPIDNLFNILDSNAKDKFKIAIILPIYNCFESIVSYYTIPIDRNKKFKIKEEFGEFNLNNDENGQAIGLKIKAIIKYILKDENLDQEKYKDFFEERNNIVHQYERGAKIDIKSSDIINHLILLKELIQKISKYH